MKSISAKEILSTLLLGVFCAFFSTAQKGSSQSIPDIQWGALERRQGTLLYILPSVEGEFYALRWSGSRLFGHYKATKHENLEQVSSARIRLVADKSIANFEGASVIDGKFVVFLSDKRDNQNNFYMQEFDDQLEKKNDIIHLASYGLNRKQGAGSFQFRTSPNKEFFGVIWELPGKKDTRDVYGFKIFDKKMQLMNEGEYKLPFDSELSEIHEHLISNSGDYFICLSEYEESDRRTLFASKIDYKALHIYRINDDLGLQDFTLDLDGKPIVSLAMHSGDNNVFTLTGIYSNNDQSSVAGVFYQKLDLESEEILQDGFQAFEEEFITQDWSERSLRRAERRRDQGKGDPELFSYKMRDVTFLEDGSIVGAMEQYYVQVRSNSDGRVDQSSNMYYYYYNDIIAYKIDTSGTFAWVEKIQKDQVSINDGGPYSSFESFVENGKVYFIFNDNLLNYDDNNNFLNPDKIESANYSRRRNAVALTSIDLETGESIRISILDREQNNTLVVPKMFTVNYRTGELIIYSLSGQKEKLGVIKLQPSTTDEVK